MIIRSLMQHSSIGTQTAKKRTREKETNDKEATMRNKFI